VGVVSFTVWRGVRVELNGCMGVCTRDDVNSRATFQDRDWMNMICCVALLRLDILKTAPAVNVLVEIGS
jgi:hypothetical protein